MRLTTNVILAGAIASGIAVTNFGHAQDRAPCMPYDFVVGRLTERYGEQPVWHGITADGVLLEVWANPAGSTWTSIVVTPEGKACPHSSGDGWTTPAPPPTPGRAT